MILIKILDHQEWSPLSKTKKLDLLKGSISEGEMISIYEGFAKYILVFLQSLVKNSIQKQKFPKKYKPLSKPYSKFKRAKGLKSGHWRSTEFLVKSLSHWKEKSGKWVIGWRSNLKHKTSGTSVATIALSNELGSKTRNIPPRPLFIPLAIGINKNIYYHFKKFIKFKYPQYTKFI